MAGSSSTARSPEENEPPQAGSKIQSFISTLGKLLLLFFLFSTISSIVFPPNRSESNSKDISIGSSDSDPVAELPSVITNLLASVTKTPENPLGPYSHIHPEYPPTATPWPPRNIWRDGTPLRLEVFLSPIEAVSYDELLFAAGSFADLKGDLAAPVFKHPATAFPPQSYVFSESFLKLTMRVYARAHAYAWDQSVNLFGSDPYYNRIDLDLRSIHPLILPHLQSNLTLFAHVFFYPAHTTPSAAPDKGQSYQPELVIYLRDAISRFVSTPIRKVRKNLLSDTEVQTDLSNLKADILATDGSDPVSDKSRQLVVATDAEPGQPAPASTVEHYLVPDLTVRLLYDFTVYPEGGIPSQIGAAYRIVPQYQGYIPPAYIDRFWVMTDTMTKIPLSAVDTVQPPSSDGAARSLTNYTLSISYAPTSLMRWQFQRQMEQAWKQQSVFGLSSYKEAEKLKSMILDTNPWLIAVTVIVSMVHTIFEFLAFKNDISHFRSLQSSRGLSANTLIYNAISHLIIFLYLCDSDTSFVILASNGCSVALELWKLIQLKNIAVSVSLAFPFIHLGARTGSATAAPAAQVDTNQSPSTAGFVSDDDTEEYDGQAYKYIMMVLGPLFVAYTGYSLYSHTFTSWYSFLLSTAVSFIYMFGFIPMTAQLYINYKLKSTAHIPMRAFIYKTLNTFIDDLFSFVIKMPWLHRLACLRDDAVFVVLLYQKWAYRVDYSRTNEFGQTFDVSTQEQIQGSPETDATKPVVSTAQQQQPKSGSTGNKSTSKPKATTTKAKATDATEALRPSSATASDTSSKGQLIESSDVQPAPIKGLKLTPLPDFDFTPRPRVGPSKWGDDDVPDEEISQELIDNQKKLREMRAQEIERQRTDPAYAAYRQNQSEEIESELRKRFGPPRDVYQPSSSSQ